MTITTSTIGTNKVTGSRGGGGGIYTGFGDESGVTHVTASTISGNEAPEGGGVLNAVESTTTLTNSTVSGNKATSDRGGGILQSSTEPLEILHSTITLNEASDGAGIYSDDSSTWIAASIIVDNIASQSGFDVGGTAITSEGYNIIGSFDPALTDLSDDDTNDLDASGFGLEALAVNSSGTTLTHNLPTGSLAVDFVGDIAELNQSSDQNGTERPLGASADAGAVEVPSICASTMTVVDQGQLHAAIRCHNAALADTTSTISIANDITYEVPVIAIDNDTTAKLIISGNNNTLDANSMSRVMKRPRRRSRDQ